MQIAKSSLSTALKELHMIAADLQAFEEELERLGAPWTPGRLPDRDVD